MNDTDQLKALFMIQAMVIAADKFHLEVAKALLSPTPLSEAQKAALRDKIAKRESDHEKQESLFRQARELLGGGQT